MKISGIKKVLVFTAVTGMLIYAFNASPARSEDFKVGYVDAQKVLDESNAGKLVRDSLNEYVISRQKIVDIEEGDLRKLEAEFSKQGALLSADAKQEKEEQLQRKYMEYQKKVAELQKEIQQRRTEKLEEFNMRIENIVRIIGDKEGFSIILNNPASNTVLYAKPSLDITYRIIEDVDKNQSKEEPKQEPKQEINIKGAKDK